ncbi:unnamed protein product [Discula destructiva]
MYAQEITQDELRSVDIVERVASVFSLLGCIFVIMSFSFSKAFHKPINRLVFYASIGNMMTNVATLMARTYVGIPGSAGCQLQAFLIQMFMPADAFWTLAMAVNVYLTFYYKYDAQKLRKMELPYLLCCYGIPFAVALTYIFISTEDRGRMYGNATIWCWVSSSWDIWRIATFYGPVWVAIAVTCFIYIRAGREIYRKHRQLKDLNYTSHYEPEPLHINNPFNTKTTEVTVSVSEAPPATDMPLSGERPVNYKHNSISAQTFRPAAYSVSISARLVTAPSSSPSPPISSAITPAAKLSRRRAAIDANNAAWSYTKVAMLFFTALLVTWIPSSANRLYSLAADGQISLPLEYMSAFVLPLQGFWNAIIYCTTSWKACRMLWEDVAAFFCLRRPTTAVTTLVARSTSAPRLGGVLRSRSRMGMGKEGDGAAGGRPFGKIGRDSASESMEELADRSRTSTP